jgi:Domain of unknown function (DUF4041)/T5orf172 domain
MMHGADSTQVPHTVTSIESQRAVWVAGPGCVRHELVGEEFYHEHMQRIAASVHGRWDVPVVTWLVAEQAGVVVWAMGSKVGYLPAEVDAVWRPLLHALQGRYNLPIACQGALDPPSTFNKGVLGMVVWLPPLPATASLPAPSPPAPSMGYPPAPAPSMGYPPAPVVPAPARPTMDPEAIRAEAQAKSQAEIASLRAELEQSRQDLAKARQDLEAAVARAREAAAPAEQLAQTREEIRKLGAEAEARRRELRSVEETLEIQSFGFYTPKYGFESSAQYTARLKGIRDEQQRLIKDDQAAPCDTKWTVGGSAAEGKKMVKQQAKLMLRAFNGECDAAITKVRYDNVVTMERRLEKAYEDINKLGEVQRVFISRRYLDLKLAELHLVHEHREKVEEEKQEQKRIREQMREEQKAQAEIERAKAEAEKEQAAAAAALEKARAELEAQAATSKQHEKLEALVGRLENELKDALDRKAKAIARAQLTRSGHVYVLSNVGSFGEGIYKIGLTRRLDPYERVDELGDASVPFPFDVHAVIFAEDAPGLETRLHKAFAARRVNLVNLRKEYFRVTLEEIQEEVKKHHGFVSFTLTAEAEEYRKSVAAREAGVVPELAAPPVTADEE